MLILEETSGNPGSKNVKTQQAAISKCTERNICKQPQNGFLCLSWRPSFYDNFTYKLSVKTLMWKRREADVRYDPSELLVGITKLQRYKWLSSCFPLAMTSCITWWWCFNPWREEYGLLFHWYNVNICAEKRLCRALFCETVVPKHKITTITLFKKLEYL